MTRLRKFLRLASRERRLLIRAALLLGTIGLGVRLLPFATIQRLLARLMKGPARGHQGRQSSPERIAWAVA